MSIIFGTLNSDEAMVSERDMQLLACATQRYAADGLFTHVSGKIGMGFQPYFTHKRSFFELQPLADKHGNLLTLDGRLDNHKELCELLNLDEYDTPDSVIALFAFRRWGESCFSRFVGDWAIALWSHECRSLYLARDHAGVRSLYIEQTDQFIRWSTYLETFFAEGVAQELDMDFAACYLTGSPSRELTPFRNIRAVPAAHYIRFNQRGAFRGRHWSPVANNMLRYKSDSEYGSHFLSLFRQSVERRSGCGAPIIAHLSGGMDSSAIVCTSDQILRENNRALHTLSYYDDSEPNWDEKPYFSVVENKRGIVGTHIQASFRDRTFEPASPEHVYLFPGSDSGSIAQEEAVNRHLDSPSYRVVLSGIGGDELLGGFPTPYPELADLLASCCVHKFLSQAFSWSAARRSPLVYTLAGTVEFIREAYFPLKTPVDREATWLTLPRSRVHRSEILLQRSMKAIRFPSSIHNARVWWNILETLPSLRPEFLVRREYRYPYLDRDLVDFLLRIPRDQLARPGRRRYMMRRALKNIVPEEILERRRKAFLDRSPILALRNARAEIRELFANSIAFRLGLLDPEELLQRLDPISAGLFPKSSFVLMRSLGYELWLQANASRIVCFLGGADGRNAGHRFHQEAHKFRTAETIRNASRQ